MNKFSKYSKIIVYGFIILNIILAILAEVYNYTHGYEVANNYVILMDIFFLLLFHFSEKVYAKRVNFLPSYYYYIALVFSFLALYLGSFQNYYEYFSWWDDVLHFSSGVLIGFLSIVLVNLVLGNYMSNNPTKKDLITLLVISFLCAVSIGVFWEFYEYSYDFLVDGNMQRSIYFTGDNYADFAPYVRESGRFIDPGLTDTMHDLFLATVGGVLACIFTFINLIKKVD